MNEPNFLAGSPLDRLPAERSREGAYDRLTARRRHRLVLIKGSQVPVSEQSAPRVAFIEDEEAISLIRSRGAPILLGVHGRRTYWAAEIPEAGDHRVEARLPGRFVELKAVGALLDATEASVLAHARAIVHFHRSHRHCGVCGHPTGSVALGGSRRCADPTCGLEVFPRTDPAVIVLLTRGARCLLARQSWWRPGQYATVAGFVEAGESLEDAVVREVREETGLEVTRLDYHSSQPWPFPSSIMIGFTARVTGTVALDPDELEDARWFTRPQLRGAVAAGEVRLPPRVSISRRLIRDWLRRDGGSQGD